MADGDVEGGNSFQHLLEPIRDLVANWNVDIAADLGDYLDALEGITFAIDGETHGLNFAEGAARHRPPPTRGFREEEAVWMGQVARGWLREGAQRVVSDVCGGYGWTHVRWSLPAGRVSVPKRQPVHMGFGQTLPDAGPCTMASVTEVGRGKFLQRLW
jgi:hypothetical protein